MEEDGFDALGGDFDDFPEGGEPEPEAEDLDNESIYSSEGESDAEEGIEETDQKRGTGSGAKSGGIIIVPPEQHVTSDFLSNNEIAEILANRAEQISRNDIIFLPPGVDRKSQDPVDLAVQELRCGQCPLIIQRVVSHGNPLVIEERPVRKLQLLTEANLPK